MPSVKVKRGTRAQLNTAAAANQLAAGEVYLITDENRIAVGLSINSYEAYAKVSESELPQVATLTSTQQSTSTTLANITELALPLLQYSIYEVNAFVTFQSAATTTGLNLGISTPTNSRNMLEIVVPITSTAAASQLRTIFPNAAIATNAGNVLGTGVTAINSNHTAKISGFIKTGSNSGNCQLLFASEVASSAITLQIGSSMFIKKIG